MADWRQIQARIRKAKNSADAPAKLSELYARTRDAMVAWELGAIEEKEARNEEAVKWYTISADRFRRPDWKKKAEEALTRLGAPIPVRIPQLKPNVEENTESFHIPATQAVDESVSPSLSSSELSETDEADETTLPAGALSAADSPADGVKKKRRRGRRGGRNRRHKGPVPVPALPTQVFAESFESQTPSVPLAQPRYTPAVIAEVPRSPRAEVFEEPELLRPSATVSSIAQRSAQGRAGDPALASRMAHLEYMLRRLVSGASHRLSEAEEAPAGPGVFLLSDSDQVTSYYVEACQTLRVGLGNLVRGGRSGKSARPGRNFSGDGLKAKLAEHLGISESKVSQYLKDHCVVRWIQLDEEAPHLAHFAIGVLRTPLNLD